MSGRAILRLGGVAGTGGLLRVSRCGAPGAISFPSIASRPIPTKSTCSPIPRGRGWSWHAPSRAKGPRSRPTIWCWNCGSDTSCRLMSTGTKSTLARRWAGDVQRQVRQPAAVGVPEVQGQQGPRQGPAPGTGGTGRAGRQLSVDRRSDRPGNAAQDQVCPAEVPGDLRTASRRTRP